MNRLLALAVALSMSGFFILQANAGPPEGTAAQTGQKEMNKAGKVDNKGRKDTVKQGYAVDKEYKKRVEAKKKAMELRERSIKANQKQ